MRSTKKLKAEDSSRSQKLVPNRVGIVLKAIEIATISIYPLELTHLRSLSLLKAGLCTL